MSTILKAAKIQKGEAQVRRDATVEEQLVIDTIRSKDALERPSRDWDLEMQISDKKLMSRVQEDLIGVLSPEQFAALPAQTKQAYANKQALRATKPQNYVPKG